MVGAFVPVALKHAQAHADGAAEAVKVARLLAAVAEPNGTPPLIVLADANGSDPARTSNAGRVTPDLGLSAAEWRTFAQGAEQVARAVRDATGLATAFHHHCAGYVETPDEIACLLELTDPALLGLVFDTGHFLFGAAGAEGSDRSERARPLWRADLAYALQGLPAADCCAIARRGLGLLRGSAARRVLRAGPGRGRFRGGNRLAARARLPWLDRGRAGCAAGHGRAQGKRRPQPCVSTHNWIINHRTYAVGVFCLRQSGTFFCWCAVFPRSARKNRTQMIVTYHAAVRPEAPLSRSKGAVEGQATDASNLDQRVTRVNHRIDNRTIECEGEIALPAM